VSARRIIVSVRRIIVLCLRYRERGRRSKGNEKSKSTKAHKNPVAAGQSSGRNPVRVMGQLPPWRCPFTNQGGLTYTARRRREASPDMLAAHAESLSASNTYEMYEEYLGFRFHRRVRQRLPVQVV
jgi:hypothetical protein